MLKLENVSKSYGSIRVLENCNFSIETGKSVCIVGRSGCGKSTLLNVIALITKPDQGRILIDGKLVNIQNEAELEAFRREKVAYSFQEPLLISYMTATENLTEVIDVPKEKAVKLLSKLGLSNRLNHKPSKLSVGEKKRVDIARALLKNSSLLVADEPLSNLDSATGQMVIDLLHEYLQNGRTVVFSSVEPSDAKFADAYIPVNHKHNSQNIIAFLIFGWKLVTRYVGLCSQIAGGHKIFLCCLCIVLLGFCFGCFQVT